MFLITLAIIFQGLVCFFINQTGYISSNNSIYCWCIIALTSVVILFSMTKYAKYKNEYFMYFFAYVFRLALLFWDTNFAYIFQLPNSGADSVMFHNVAVRYATGQIVSTNSYSSVLANIYRMFGIQEILGRYFNVVFAMFSIFLLSQIFTLLNLSKSRRYIGLVLISFLPNYAVMSVITLRESLIIFLLTLSLYLFVKWWQNNNILMFFLACIPPLYAATFHSGAIAPLLGYLICLTFYDRKASKFKFKKSTVLIVIICIFAFGIINDTYGDKIFARFNSAGTAEEIINKSATSRGGSGYSVYINTGNTTADMIVNTPIRIFYFILSPLPWDWRGLNDIIAFVFSAVFYAVCYVVSIKKLRDAGCDKETKNMVIILLIMALVSALIFAWGVSNAGTALRHRDKFIVHYVLMFVLAFENEKLSDRGD